METKEKPDCRQKHHEPTGTTEKETGGERVIIDGIEGHRQAFDPFVHGAGLTSICGMVVWGRRRCG